MLSTRSLSLAVLGCALAAPLAGQGTNCALLGTFNNHGPFNDVWGYTAPNGDEYALLGSTTGTVVVDITNPGSPIERGWFPWGSSSWRDIRTYGSYAYVVTEATAGVQVIDLSNPNSPSQVGFFGTSISNSAHNICIDLGTGRCYLPGSSAGTPVWDLSVNPTNPPYLGTVTANYNHDLCVENGYAYASQGTTSRMRILDANSPLPFTSLSDAAVAGGYAHNAWPNAAGTLCATTNESTGGMVKFFDITNKANPIQLSQYTPNPGTIPHNAFIVGDKCHISWYTEGYICLDISDPTNPVLVAQYDTWPGASGGFNGCWGCYPFLPSGNILASDRATGLYIVRPGNATFTPYGQGCPGTVTSACPELNGNGGTLTGASRANEYAYTVQNSSSLLVHGFDIFCQSGGGTVTLPAHIYADLGGIPSPTPLASTTITLNASASFYTATLASAVPVSGNFYISIDSRPGATIVSTLTSCTPGGAFYRNANVPNFTASGLVAAPSYRVSCTSTSTAVPEIGNVGVPLLGTTYNVTLASAKPSSAAFFLTGLSDSVHQGTALPAALPGAPGCSIYAAPDSNRLLITGVQGDASVPNLVPANSAFIGLTLFHQWAILDSANSLGIVVSNAGRAVVDG